MLNNKLPVSISFVTQVIRYYDAYFVGEMSGHWPFSQQKHLRHRLDSFPADISANLGKRDWASEPIRGPVFPQL